MVAIFPISCEDEEIVGGFFFVDIVICRRHIYTRFSDEDGRRPRRVVYIAVHNVIIHIHIYIYIIIRKGCVGGGGGGVHASRAWRGDYLVPSSPVARIYIPIMYIMYRPWAVVEKSSAQTDTALRPRRERAKWEAKTRTRDDRRNRRENACNLLYRKS